MLEAGGNTLNSHGRAFLPDDRIGTETGRIGTHRTIVRLFAVNRSLSESMQSSTLSVLRFFSSQEIGTNTFSLSHAKFQQFFLLSISLATVAFSLVNLQLIASGVNTDASTWLLLSDLFRTYSKT